MCNLKQRGEAVGKCLLCKAIAQGLRVGVLPRPDIEQRRTSVLRAREKEGRPHSHFGAGFRFLGWKCPQGERVNARACS